MIHWIPFGTILKEKANIGNKLGMGKLSNQKR